MGFPRSCLPELFHFRKWILGKPFLRIADIGFADQMGGRPRRDLFEIDQLETLPTTSATLNMGSNSRYHNSAKVESYVGQHAERLQRAVAPLPAAKAVVYPYPQLRLPPPRLLVTHEYP